MPPIMKTNAMINRLAIILADELVNGQRRGLVLYHTQTERRHRGHGGNSNKCTYEFNASRVHCYLLYSTIKYYSTFQEGAESYGRKYRFYDTVAV